MGSIAMTPEGNILGDPKPAKVYAFEFYRICDYDVDEYELFWSLHGTNGNGKYYRKWMVHPHMDGPVSQYQLVGQRNCQSVSHIF